MNVKSKLSSAALLLAATAAASATTIHIAAPVVCVYSSCDGTPEHDYGELVIDLNATGLPATLDTVASVSDVSASLTLSDGTQFFGSGGSGQVMADTEYADILSFAAGAFNAYIDVPVSWTGNGSLPYNDGENSSFLQYGGFDYYLNGGESSTVTPEPGSISLMLLGLGSTGCAWVSMGRRRLLGR